MKKNMIDITVCGRRIKYEAQKRGYKNQDIADLLHYSSGKQISPFYNGKQQFSNDQIDLLSTTFGLRKEYLLCLDDWETEEERIQSLKNKDILDYQKTTLYLNSLGYRITPSYFWVCSEQDLYNGFTLFEPYVDGSELTTELYDFVNKEQGKLSDHRDNIIKLKALPQDDNENSSLPLLQDITKQETTYWDNFSITDYGEIALLYEVYFNNTFLNYVPLYKIQCFFNHIDNLCKSTAQYLLSSDIFAYDDIDL